eukprot:COSAG04_NODE_2257_length_4433_cov_2.916244_1_plen_656_part_00
MILEARTTFLEARRSEERPIGKWSVEQVREWISLLGLPPESVDIVQKALTGQGGAIVDAMTTSFQSSRNASVLEMMLTQVEADEPVALAKEAMELHEQALATGALPHGRLAAAEEDLDAARQAVCENRTAVSSQVVHLVSLASQHFPELKKHPDVQAFTGSDGLQAYDQRQLADYDAVFEGTQGEGSRSPGTNVLRNSGMHELTRWTFDSSDVCLKEFKVQGVSDRAVKAYLKEVQNVQRLRHPYIIIYDAVFEERGCMYLQMPYFKHGSLRHWIDQTNPDEAATRKVLRKILVGVTYMHSREIVHRDLKGDNVLIADDEAPLICDFEMSKDQSQTESTTQMGGSWAFMAPEVQNRTGKPSKASDMFAFGVIIVNTLHPPLDGERYPCTDPSRVTEPALAGPVNRLLSEEPRERPTAAQLEAEPYFESEQVDEWGRVDVGQCSSTKPCRDELLDAGADALGVPEIESAVQAVDNRIRSLPAYEDMEQGEKDRRFAIFLYTQPRGKAYSKFNEALRTRRGALFDAWSPFLWHLMAALKVLPDVAGTFYRGMHDVPNLDRYTKEERIHWSGFNSTSTNPDVAKRFHEHGEGVVFKLIVQNAKNVQLHSYFGDAEGELLLNPNMEFLVTKELHSPADGPLEGCNVIEMQQIPNATLWS